MKWTGLAAAGAVLGAALLADWPSYREYSALTLSPVWRHLLTAAAGALVVAVAREPWHYLAGGAVVVGLALILPFVATCLTVHLIGTPELLWPMLYGTARTAMGLSIGLLFFLGVGMGVAVLTRAFAS